MKISPIAIGEIIWGLVKDKPQLPEGWIYLEGRRDWLFAISPTGQPYYVSTKALYPRRIWDHGPNKGKPYIDTRQEVMIEL